MFSVTEGTLNPNHWLYTDPLRLRSIFRRSRVERELNEELRFHLEPQVEHNVGRGMNAREARRQALPARSKGFPSLRSPCGIG